VVGVSDGDTITILDASNTQIKIRYAQIDAPESGQDFGQASKRSLSDLVYGKTVTVQVETLDKYGRTVGKVIADGIDTNLEQVKRGMAWVYVKYAHDPAYYAAEKAAKADRQGLWSQPNPIPPWDYRHCGGTFCVTSPGAAPASAAPDTGSCGEKRFCKQMADCAEAMHYLKDCGLYKLDKDGDGVPCESLCR
jgi:hypothetical protein